MSRFGRRQDAEAVDRAEAIVVETPAEKAQRSGSIEGMAADGEAARMAGEASVKDTDRLGD
jgi:hypothetical protein